MYIEKGPHPAPNPHEVSPVARGSVAQCTCLFRQTRHLQRPTQTNTDPLAANYNSNFRVRHKQIQNPSHDLQSQNNSNPCLQTRIFIQGHPPSRWYQQFESKGGGGTTTKRGEKGETNEKGRGEKEARVSPTGALHAGLIQDQIQQVPVRPLVVLLRKYEAGDLDQEAAQLRLHATPRPA